jgi:zinc D-Ala-D-Ala carboxypeptidase
MIIAPHFDLIEFLRSSDWPNLSADVRGVDTPPEVLLNISRLTFTCLVPLRDRFGVLKITSGFRPPALNKAVGGSIQSRHLTGCAADFVLADVDPEEAWAEICAGGVPWRFDRLAYYTDGRFHVDIQEEPHQRGLLFVGDSEGWRPA